MTRTLDWSSIPHSTFHNFLSLVDSLCWVGISPFCSGTRSSPSSLQPVQSAGGGAGDGGEGPSVLGGDMGLVDAGLAARCMGQGHRWMDDDNGHSMRGTHPIKKQDIPETWSSHIGSPQKGSGVGDCRSYKLILFGARSRGYHVWLRWAGLSTTREPMYPCSGWSPAAGVCISRIGMLGGPRVCINDTDNGRTTTIRELGPNRPQTHASRASGE